MEIPGQFPSLELAPTLEPLAVESGDVRTTIERLASMRFRHVQLSATHRGLRPRDLDASARRDLLATLRRSEITASGIDLWIPTAHLLDPANVDRAVDAIQSAIRLASDLGRCPLSLLLPKESDRDQSGNSTTQSPVPSPIDLNAMINSIASSADHHGVAIADHAVPGSTWEGIGVGIDPPAWLAQNIDIIAALPAHGQRLVAARVSDLLTSGLRGPIGDPHHRRLDAQAYHLTLAAVGFQRPVVVDARQWREPWQGLAQSQREWQTISSG